ncbi:MAG: DNA recombination protein RmuC [Endomicrobiia bacterium]
MNLVTILSILIVALLVYLIYLFKKLNEQKLTDFITKLELSSQLVNELKNSVFNSLALLQNHINQTINQVSATDNTLRTQLELLRNSINEQISFTVKNLNMQIKTTTDATSKSLELVTQQIDERLKGTIEIFSQMSQMLSRLNFFAEELKVNTDELNKILGATKLRGSFGEVLLEKVLLDVFPQEKVKFNYYVNPHSSEHVEAAVLFKDKVFPIDSKFNLDKIRQLEEAKDEASVRRAEKDLIETLKKQIDEIAEKYVLPQYGADYAFMYIPSESGFLRIINLKLKDGESIVKYASKKHVVIASPQTLLPYLQYVIIGIQTEQIAKNAVYLRQQINSLIMSITKFQEKFSTLGKHIKNAYERYTEVESDLKMLEMQVKNITAIDTVQQETLKLSGDSK